MTVRLRAAATLAALMSLAGCATLPPAPPGAAEAAWHRHEAAVLAQTPWSLDGNFGLRIGHRGWSAGLRWVQTGDRFHIDIYDPLGRTVAVLTGKPGDVTLADSSGRAYRAASAAELMQHALGWSLPVGGLRYWVRGVPVANAPVQSRQLDANGRLRVLQQSGWYIRYSDYDYDTANARPTRMIMTHGDVRLVLVVNQWGKG
ncbi:outer membrane lipoprotein LolB [Acidihalobacter aeolianus]|uniref:Outer-membrane lipoprotein LolB n=1 Tax=Acidihalobacter aeolianus TaxID=2792603 RepID=A0A1D8KAL0_9GAMM|nr:outer membrane lipoprotein LolB [Acidihalobacter aeolianus]